MKLIPIIGNHLELMTTQMVDSQLESTRVFWRNKLGFSEEIQKDPRPLLQIIREKK